MFSYGNRSTKSQSMMASLYLLSSLAIFLLLAFIFSTLFHIAFQFDLSSLSEVAQIILWSLLLCFLALLISSPIAAALTYLVVSRVKTRGSHFIDSTLYVTSQAPVLLFGLVFLYFFGTTTVSLVLTLVLMALSQLTRRWVHLSRRVPKVEIESMQSLGMGLGSIIFNLYIRQFFGLYLAHFFAVLAQVFVLLTPLLCLFYFGDSTLSFYSLEFYQNIGLDLGKTSVFASLALFAHGLRVWLDHHTSIWEVEYG